MIQLDFDPRLESADLFLDLNKKMNAIVPHFQFNCRSKVKFMFQSKYRFRISMQNLLTKFFCLFFYWLKYV